MWDANFFHIYGYYNKKNYIQYVYLGLCYGAQRLITMDAYSCILYGENSTLKRVKFSSDINLG